MPKKKKVSKKRTTKKSKKDDDRKLFAFLATFLSILGFIIALLAKKDDKYVMFYAKQSLVVFIAYVVALIIAMIPGIGLILGPIAYLLSFILWLISWIYALSGNMKTVPVIGDYAKNINL